MAMNIVFQQAGGIFCAILCSMKIVVQKRADRALLVAAAFLLGACGGSDEQGENSAVTASNEESAQKSRQDWPLFRRDAEMQGVSVEDLKPPLKLVWEFDLAKEEASPKDGEAKKNKRSAPIKATAAIQDGLVYVGSEDSQFVCLDLKDGGKRWQFKSEGPISGSAAVIGERVYFGCQHGFLYALDRRSGKELWRFETDDKIEGGVNALEVVDSATGKTQTRLFFGSYDNHLYAVDAETGKLIWKYETENYLVATPSVVAGENPSVIVGGCDGLLHVVSAMDGKEMRNFDIGAYIPNSAGVRDGIAYVAHFGGEIGAYDVNAGEEVWKIAVGNGVEMYASPAVTSGRVYVGGRDKLLRCLERMNGKEIWRFATRRHVDSSPVVCDTAVYVGGMDGRLYAVDPESGEELWSYEIGAKISASPAISNGTLVISSEDGVVYAFKGEG